MCFYSPFRKQIQDLNWQRKNDQLAGGSKLRELESKSVLDYVSVFKKKKKNTFQNLSRAKFNSISLLSSDGIVFACFHSWVSLVSKNYEIERAIVQLENEVAQMKQQQGDENKENIRQDF